MARAGTLAGLAALGTAAYLMSKGKDKDKDEPKGKEDTGPGYKSTETRLESPAESIAKADKSDKSSSISTKGASGTTTPGPDTSAPKLDTEINKPVVSRTPPKTTTASKPAAPTTTTVKSGNRGAEAGVSRGTRPADVSKMYGTRSGVMGGARQPDAKPSVSKPSQDESKVGGAAVGSLQRQSTSSSEPPKPKKGIGPYNVFAGPDEPSKEASEKASRSLADKSSKYQSEPMLYNPFSKENRERMGSAYKKGGAVKKMASGGMTASKRADGIASRGKTKCKMY